jgi:hypothetical protein
MSNIIRGVFIVIFVGLMLLPTAQYYFSPLNLPQLKEGRTKLPFPGEGDVFTVIWDVLSKQGAIGKLTAYFDDNFVFRDLLIMLANQIRYDIFKESSQVVVGKDGWLYDRVVITRDQPNADRMSDEDLMRVVGRIKQLDDYLAGRGIHLLLVPVPLKNTVMDDNLGARYPRISPNIYERFVARLADSGVDFVDVREVLRNPEYAKSSYFKTDLHWTYVGAALVAKEIVNRIGRRFGGDVVWQEAAASVVREAEFSGGEARSMGLLRPVFERNSVIKPAVIGCVQAVSPPADPFGAEYRKKENLCKIPLLPKTVMVGNSFNMYFEATGIFEYFSHAFRLWDVYMFTKPEDLIPAGSKVVVLQLYELQLSVQYASDAWWQKFDSSAAAQGNGGDISRFSRGGGRNGFVEAIRPNN